MMTNNKSFKDFYEEQKSKGYGDFDFILNTKNKQVSLLNPFSEQLTDKQKEMIIEEVKNNKWYFFREVVRIPEYGDGSTHMFMNRMIFDSFLAKEEGKSTFISSARQSSKSYQEAFYAIWEVISLGKKFIIFKNSNFFRNIRNIFDKLPEYIKNEVKFYNHFRQESGYRIAHQKDTGGEKSVWIFDESLPKEFNIKDFENNVRITCVPIRNKNYIHWFKLWRRLEEYKQSGYNPDKFVKITYNWRQLGMDQEWYNMTVNYITPNDDEFRKKFIKQELEVDWEWDYIKETLLDKIEKDILNKVINLSAELLKLLESEQFEINDILIRHIESNQHITTDVGYLLEGLKGLSSFKKQNRKKG